MAIFSPRKPRLDGLTRGEEKRREALLAEVAERATATNRDSVLVAALRERMAAAPAEGLWPLLLGGEMMETRRFGRAIEAFEVAIADSATRLRARYGAAMANYRAAEYKLEYGEAAVAEVAPPAMTIENLYQAALRHFRRAQDLTSDKAERDELASAAAVVERAVARKRGRL
jgi:tetratricopeptide (TPR) repeat protein